MPTVWMNKKYNHWSAQECSLDKTDQKHNMQRKKQRDSCFVQRVLRSVCSNVCVMITARHPYTAGVFHNKKCQSCSSTQLIVVLPTAESEYVSITKGAAHALEVSSAMVEFGMTFNVVCVRLTRRLDWQWARDVV